MANRIQLQGQLNFRDLGGLVTVDGRVIRKGLVYRSGELCHLTDADLRKLDDLGIKMVIDFRSKRELQISGQDRLPTDAVYQHLPIDFGDLTNVIWQGFEDGDFSKISSNLLADLNAHNFLYSTTQYASLLKELIHNNSVPLVFHCSHGKDRVGIGTAILLLALGVPKAQVIKNYLASNHYRAEATKNMLRDIRLKQASKHSVSPESIDLSGLEAIYFLKASHFEEAFKLLMDRYQSFDAYLIEALRLTPAEITELQNNLLQSND